MTKLPKNWGKMMNGTYFSGDIVIHNAPIHTDAEYETLMRKLLEGLKGKEVGIGNDTFVRGYNTAIREMNEKIDEVIKKLEI